LTRVKEKKDMYPVIVFLTVLAICAIVATVLFTNLSNIKPVDSIYYLLSLWGGIIAILGIPLTFAIAYINGGRYVHATVILGMIIVISLVLVLTLIPAFKFKPL
jgi:hypothetical protein